MVFFYCHKLTFFYQGSSMTHNFSFCSIIAITCPYFAIKSEGLDTSPALCTNTSAAIQYLQECSFTCRDGYQQNGPVIKTCGQSKTWFPSGNPSCRGLNLRYMSRLPLNVKYLKSAMASYMLFERC